MSFNILSGAIKYMKGRPGALIPAETKTGQLSMLPYSFGRTATSSRGVIGRGLGGRVSNQSPPFVTSRRVTNTGGMAAAKAAARREELVMKRMKAHSKRRIGPLTEVEYVDDLFGKYK